MSIRRLLQIGLRGALVAPLLVLGCNTIDNPVSISLPDFGTLIVTTETSGSNLDANGYRLIVTGASLNANREMELNGSVAFSVAGGGECVVELIDIAANCSTDANPRSVSVSVESVATVSFTVSCS